MLDQFGRNIGYMRLSLTDRCNLRCRYCMPEGVALASHADMLRHEERLRICEAAAALGIDRFKVTGGEPLVRRGCVDFIAQLKAVPEVRQVTLTTNGLLLAEYLDALETAGIDGINVSIDTLDPGTYHALTGAPGESVAQVLAAIESCAGRGIKTKVNAVLLAETFSGLVDLAQLAQRLPVDVRFIELMPIGEGLRMQGVSMEVALAALRGLFPDLHAVDERRGNGPARYYASAALRGRIGFIDALSHAFCANCNRVRLTAAGTLKPCLCYEEGLDVRQLLRAGCTDAELQTAMAACIKAKPRAHSFALPEHVTEKKNMNQIGG